MYFTIDETLCLNCKDGSPRIKLDSLIIQPSEEGHKKLHTYMCLLCKKRYSVKY